jgi:hypothetical protein
MLGMTSAPSRLVLVPASPRSERDASSVRRYRLARLRLVDREVDRAKRFDRLKRTYD